jgi:AcrR family transcriptional regulator
VQVVLDAWECDVHHGRVEDEHELAGEDDRQDQAAAARRLRAVGHPGLGTDGYFGQEILPRGVSEVETFSAWYESDNMESVSGCASEFGESLRLTFKEVRMPGGEPSVDGRPMRADARRNYERIVGCAKELFTSCGADAPLDDIAKKAGVGAGTLYRHFPTREKLIEAVYRDEIGQLADRAYTLHDELPPWEALESWLNEQVAWIVDRHKLAMLLKEAIDQGSETFRYCQVRLREATGLLVAAAQEAGLLRPDVTGVDVLRLGHGAGMAVKNCPPDEGKRVLAVILDGLRAG